MFECDRLPLTHTTLSKGASKVSPIGVVDIGVRANAFFNALGGRGADVIASDVIHRIRRIKMT